MKGEKVERFEDLWLWQRARELVVLVYGDFRQGDGSRDFGFRNQIERASVSVMNNIAEGFERRTDADFARLLDVARGSCAEVRSMYYAAEDLGYLAPNTAKERRGLARKIASGIATLTRHLRSP